MKKLLTALFSFLLIFSFALPVAAAGDATLDLSPLTATKSVDNLFSVEVRVNSAGLAVNTVKAYMTFDPNVLEVTSVSTSGSMATIFTENEPDNLNGTVHITGAASGTGYTGTTGLFATINFRAKAAGTSTLTFTSESRVISSSDNSDILNFTGLKNGSYTVGSSSITTTTGSGAAGDGTTEATDSSLPQSGAYTSTITLIGLAFMLILGGLFVANPYLFAPKLAKRNQIKNILKKL